MKMAVENEKSTQSSRQKRINHIRIISRAALSVYFAVSIPLRFTFIPDYTILDFDIYGIYIALDLLCSIFLLVDTITEYWEYQKTRVAPVENEIMLTRIQREAAEHQRTLRESQTRFVLGILTSVPLEYVTLMIPQAKQATIYLTINKLLTVYYLPSFIQDLSILIEVNGIIRSIGLQRAWELFFVMALAGHWCCCGFYFVAKMEAIHGDQITWAENLGLIKHSRGGGVEMSTSVPEAYIQSLYWAYITMVNTGTQQLVCLHLPLEKSSDQRLCPHLNT